MVIRWFSPENLPSPIKEQLKKYKHISLFVTKVFKDLQSKCRLVKLILEQDVEAILKLHIHILTAPRSPSPITPSKYSIGFVLGMGCKEKDEKNLEKAIMTWCMVNSIQSIKHVDVYCKDSLWDAFKAFFKGDCYSKPAKTNVFVKKITKKVTKMLDEGKKVIFIGHSFGGSVLGLVAETLNSHKNIQNLQIATFGSIFISKKKDVKNVKIKQYMLLNDPSLKCSKIAPPIGATRGDSYHDPDTNIIWIKPEPEVKRTWSINVSYDNLIHKIMQKQNVDIF